jgi:Tetracyclin repressor-like, C-terminal domain
MWLLTVTPEMQSSSAISVLERPFPIKVSTLLFAATGPDGFPRGGHAYIAFALPHRGHFEVMFRPYLFRSDDAKLVLAKKAAFDILYGTARTSLTSHRSRPAMTSAGSPWRAGHCPTEGDPLVSPADLSPLFRAVVMRVEGSNRWTSRAFRTLWG